LTCDVPPYSLANWDPDTATWDYLIWNGADQAFEQTNEDSTKDVLADGGVNYNTYYDPPYRDYWSFNVSNWFVWWTGNWQGDDDDLIDYFDQPTFNIDFTKVDEYGYTWSPQDAGGGGANYYSATSTPNNLGVTWWEGGDGP
jgi:hypothetical protein